MSKEIIEEIFSALEAELRLQDILYRRILGRKPKNDYEAMVSFHNNCTCLELVGIRTKLEKLKEKYLPIKQTN